MARPSKDTPQSDILFSSRPSIPLSPLTLIINFAHHGLQTVLLPCLINGSSIQGDGVSLPGLLGTCGPFSPELRDIQ